jgi:hypothetical protein
LSGRAEPRDCATAEATAPAGKPSHRVARARQRREARELGRPGIGGLFDIGELDFLNDCSTSSQVLQSAVRSLSVVRGPKSGVLRLVGYRKLGAEELCRHIVGLQCGACPSGSSVIALVIVMTRPLFAV